MEQRHSTFSIDFYGSNIKIESNFDSGNLEGAQVTEGRVVLTPAFDPMHPQYSLKQSSKTFFHFSIQSSNQIQLPITIKRMKILQYFASVLKLILRMNSFRSTIEFVLVIDARKDGNK